MTLEQISTNELAITAGAGAAIRDENTRKYIFDCLQRFYSVDYGMIPAEDAAANNAEIEAGQGRIIGRYEQAHTLRENILIIAYFSDNNRETDYNYTTVLYPSEY